jgi:hypothetical protein
MLVKKLAIGTAVAAMFFFGAGSAALAADVAPTSGDCTVSLDDNGNKVEDCTQVDPAVDGSTDGSGDVPAEPDVTLIDPGQPCTTTTDGDGNEIQVCPRVMYDKAGGINPIAYNFRGATGAANEDPTPAPTPELLNAPIACGDTATEPSSTDPSTDINTNPTVGCVNPVMYKDATADATCSSTTDADGNTQTVCQDAPQTVCQDAPQTVCQDALMYTSGLATGIDGKNIYDSGVFGGSAAAVIIAVVASTVLLRKRNA